MPHAVVLALDGWDVEGEAHTCTERDTLPPGSHSPDAGGRCSRWHRWQLDAGRVHCFCFFSGSCFCTRDSAAQKWLWHTWIPPCFPQRFCMGLFPQFCEFCDVRCLQISSHLRASAGIASVARTGVSLKSQWRPQFPTSRGLTCGWEEHFVLNSWEKWFWRLLKRHLGSGKNYLLKNRKKNTL